MGVSERSSGSRGGGVGGNACRKVLLGKVNNNNNTYKQCKSNSDLLALFFMANFRQLMKCWLRLISGREWEGRGRGRGRWCEVSSAPAATITKTHKQT